MRELGAFQPSAVDALFRGSLIHGLVPSQAADTAHDTTISPGAVRQESGTENYRLAAALTKQIDAAWAEGTDQGGLDGTESVPGTPDANTWYHGWLIRNSTTSAIDAIYSESATSPSVPSGWEWERRIFQVLTDGSANIIAYHAYETAGGGLDVNWDLRVQDSSANNPGTAAVTQALTVPTGINVFAKIMCTIITTTTTRNMLITEIAQTDTAPDANANHDIKAGTDARFMTAHMTRRTDTSAQIRFRFDSSDANLDIVLNTIGWIDPRLA